MTIIAVVAVNTPVRAQSVREVELERIEINKKYDKLKLREKDYFVVDCSEQFLVENKGQNAVGDFSIAKVPPTVKLQILPDLDPEYFLTLEDPKDAYMTAWANWARITRSDDNRFFFPVSNHLGWGCQINLYEYSPARNIVHKVLDVDQLLDGLKTHIPMVKSMATWVLCLMAQSGEPHIMACIRIHHGGKTATGEAGFSVIT